MTETWIKCVSRVYEENKEKHGKTPDGKYKYKLKNAMKDARKEYTPLPKLGEEPAAKNKSRKGQKTSRGKTAKK